VQRASLGYFIVARAPSTHGVGPPTPISSGFQKSEHGSGGFGCNKAEAAPS
jgi:hypothetical protein